MHPLVRGLLGPWEPRFEVLVPLLVFGALYTTGWLRLRRQSKRQKLATAVAAGKLLRRIWRSWPSRWSPPSTGWAPNCC